MQQLLLFPDHEPTTLVPSQSCYLALRASSLSGEALRALTPKLMLWENDVWVLDLSPCLSYWELMAQQKQNTLFQQIEEELNAIINSRQTQDSEHAQAYIACLGDDPWSCLLAVSLLAERALQGFFSSQNRMLQNLWSSLSWQTWWDMLHALLTHQNDPKLLVQFKKSRRSMQLAMHRLGFSSPYAARSIPSSQIRRRFGVTIADFWERTWNIEKGGSLPFSPFFPWTYLCIEEPLQLDRNLDSLLSNWSDIEEFLRSDLNRLAFLDSFKDGQRILAMEWRIVLYNLQEIPLPILFRHPHCIRQESPHQRTALLQIFYAFQNFLRQHKRLSEEPSWIAGWRLSITSSWRRLPLANSLFEPESHDIDKLMMIENQLDRPLESYQIASDWLPEDSFVTLEARAPHDKNTDLEHGEHLLHLGRQRPLFLMKAIESFDTAGQSRLWKFRERTMDKWWLTHRPKNMVRDYYQVLSNERLSWVFRDAEGRFFLHGIYG